MPSYDAGTMEEYHTSVAKSLVGVVKVDIISIDFNNALGLRIPDPKVTEKLVKLFKELKKHPDPSEHLESTRLIWDNHVEADVDPNELDVLLQNSRLTKDDLQQSISNGRYPKLRVVQRKLQCLHGRHRLLAATRVLEPEDCWWPVQIYCFQPDDPHRWEFRRERSEQFRHETKFSDGEIYRKIRDCQKHGLEDEADRWKRRLTEHKQGAVNKLLGCMDIVAALDPLLDYPGLWGGLELGNIDFIWSMHSPEQFISYAGKILEVWDKLTLGLREIREAVDISTVLGVQQRAPSVNESDRRFIVDGMDDDGPLFSAVIDSNQRESIKEALLAQKGIIPTLKSLHENSKVMDIVTKIFKSHLLRDGRMKKTMYETLSAQWSSPGSFPVQVREERFRNINIPERDQKTLAFIQLCLSSVRDFPYLIKMDPQTDQGKDKIEGRIDPEYRFRLLRRAQLLGYETKKMVAGLKTPPKREDPPKQGAAPGAGVSPLQNVYGESLKRRWGRPYTNSFRQFRTQLFLPNLFEAQVEQSAGPSAAFVQQDLWRTFFSREISKLHNRTTQILQLLAATKTERYGLQSQFGQNVSFDRPLTPQVSSLWSEEYPLDDIPEETHAREETCVREETYVREDICEQGETPGREETRAMEEIYVQEDICEQEETREMEEIYVRGETRATKETRVEEIYVQEETRARKETRAPEETRAMEETSVMEETRARKKTRVMEETRATEETSATEETRATGETHTAEETGATEETRAMEEIYVQEETRARKDTCAMEEIYVREQTCEQEETCLLEGIAETHAQTDTLTRSSNSPQNATGVDTLEATVLSTPQPVRAMRCEGNGELTACHPPKFSTSASSTPTTAPLDILPITEEFEGRKLSGVFRNVHGDLEWRSSLQTSFASPGIVGPNGAHFKVPSPVIFSEGGSENMEWAVPSPEYPELIRPPTFSSPASSEVLSGRYPPSCPSIPTDSPHFSFSRELEYLPSPQATHLGRSPSDCPSFLEWPTLDGIVSNHHPFIPEPSESCRSFLDLQTALSPAGPGRISPISDWASQVRPAYEFVLYNGMLQIPKIEYDMERYLKFRRGWRMIVTRGCSAKTLRPEYIVERMNKRGPGEKFVLVKPSYIDQFLQIHAKSKRADDARHNKLAFVNTKRIKLR